jgi:glycerol-3-phosphate dehydrogenase (NAD(P)+)
MAKIVILGAGMMGSAFTVPLTDNGHDVRLVGTHLDGDIVEEVHESHFHPRLRARLAQSVQPYTHDRLEEALRGADLVVLGVNSLGVDWASGVLGALIPPSTPLIMLTKGLAGDGQRLRILPDALRSGLPDRCRDSLRLMAIGGPSIAGELAARRHTCVVLTGPDASLLSSLATWLRTPYYHVWTSTDMTGVEVCVAMKNLYALAVGLVGGLLEKDGVAESGAVMYNVAAALFAQGLTEINYLVRLMGGQVQSVYTLPGAGDLYVTSQGGRNCRMGRYLGLGMPYSRAKAQYMPDDTIEGAELARAIGPTVESLIQSGKLDGSRLPLMRTMLSIVCHDGPPDIPWDQFFTEKAPGV